ncbi:hypothetical protein ATC04_02240 [Arthrobacter sp. YC-RL1]|nr:hypothetical protein ATC04_02240 [Arthrobacter sp. YC-RL1]
MINELVKIRQKLTKDGWDYGPKTIHYEATINEDTFPGGKIPSIATIGRLLAGVGHVDRNPRKRPKSSYVPFARSTAMALWQLDAFKYRTAKNQLITVYQLRQTRKAYFFVASLPYSGLVFCKAFSTMKQESWNQAHVNALSFYGGVPQLIVPDNAHTATRRRRGKDSEVVVTAAYRQLAEHYQCAIVPARKNRPRDKAHVERMVQAVETRIIGYLASQTWSCLDELNDAVHERLVDLNDRLRRVNGSTRRELFEAEEAALLAPLPDDPFESVEYKQLKVGRNYHVTSDYQHYSVPYELAGKILSVRMTARTVSMFDGQV